MSSKFPVFFEIPLLRLLLYKLFFGSLSDVNQIPFYLQENGHQKAQNILVSICGPPLLLHTHTHTHTYIYIYIYNRRVNL